MQSVTYKYYPIKTFNSLYQVVLIKKDYNDVLFYFDESFLCSNSGLFTEPYILYYDGFSFFI